jgi:hypothetical protein
MPKDTKYYTYQQASLSQKASFKNPILQKLSGSDQELSDSIGILWYLGETGLMDKKDTEFILGLLDVLRLSHFATSEKTNEISKLGFMMPKQDEDEDWSEDESG